LRYTYDDEDALVGFAALLGAGMRLLQVETAEDGTQPAPATFEESGEPLPIRYYAADHSVFLGEDYLIKGVAGAIFWKLASEHVTSGRIAFSNRELRLDPALRLPEAADNLEARLLLLSRRLAERDTAVRIEKAGRGRFNLVTRRPLRLIAS
jgi:adenylate cyclase